jgi:predicted PurR-regulated permease PerM
MMERQQLIERVLALTTIALVAVGCVWVLQPFLSSLMWAVILCYASWPVYALLERRLKGRRTLAATLMTIGVAMVLVLPFVIVGISLADSVADSVTAVREWFSDGVPTLPGWIAGLPVIGDDLAGYWAQLSNTDTLMEQLKDLAPPLRNFAVAVGATLGRGTFEIALSVFIAFFVFRRGTELADALTAALTRVVGPIARHFLEVAGGTIKGVVYGILGTALAQGILAGLGFLVFGVPGALFLGFLTFFMSLIPMGPPFVWVPAVIWLASKDHYIAAVLLAIWGTFAISGVDNVVKPYLISRGSRMPFVLVFLGVIGGVLAFGFIGVFLGPVLLALGYTLVLVWIEGDTPATVPAEGTPATADTPAPPAPSPQEKGPE